MCALPCGLLVLSGVLCRASKGWEGRLSWMHGMYF